MLPARRLVLAVLAVVAAALAGAAPATAAPGEVLMLDVTLSGGASSTLAQKFVAAGKTPVVISSATWSGMTAAQFDAYDAIVLGDPTCSGSAPSAPAANASTWSSVVDGNVVVIGTDETYHQSQGGAMLMEKAAAFSVAQAGKTGAYISLSCYYHATSPFTPVPMLNGFGTFTVTGVGCYNDAHIVATHPALSGLTDATLSNWSCSVHEAFDSWPLSFEVLAIARGIGTSYTATDGSTGTPYILARGVTVISDISLSPADATNDVGTSHTVTATVTTNDPAAGTPVVGKTVTFTVIAGPHSGTTGTGVTDSAGKATFAYTGSAEGIDTIEATFVDAAGRTQRSNRVTKTWVKGSGPTCDGKAPTATTTGTSGGKPAIFGTAGDDVIIGTSASEVIFGYGGNDVICAGDGNDSVRAGDGNDKVLGEGGADSVLGQGGDDRILGGDGDDDVLSGGAGNDIIDGDAGNDHIHGDGGNDTLRGGAGQDDINGYGGNDDIDGGDDFDRCDGDAGINTVLNCEADTSHS